MLVLVANLGSTSFKYRLFRFDAQERAELLAKGGYERVTDYRPCIADALSNLVASGAIADAAEVRAVGFKAVLGKGLSGCVPGDERAVAALAGFADVAPAHNPPYANGLRQFAEALPGAFRACLFETAFYQWMPEAAQHYAVPRAWYEAGIRRYGYHGASHKFVAERSAELLGQPVLADGIRRLYLDGPPAAPAAPVRVVSCHLGGSSSVCGIVNGLAQGASMGFSPQSGLPQNNRVGDLDSMALGYALKALGLTLDEAQRQLSAQGGLFGLSGGVGNDMRDLKAAADAGHPLAKLAIDVFIRSLRHYVGSFFFDFGGAEALVFTGGIGEHNPWFREAVCAGLEGLGIVLDPTANAACKGAEATVSAPHSRTRVLVIPANEELVVARETLRLARRHGLS